MPLPLVVAAALAVILAFDDTVGLVRLAASPSGARAEVVVVEVEPDGGPQAAYFPQLDPAAWRRDLLEEVPASDGVPAHRYERLGRITPVWV